MKVFIENFFSFIKQFLDCTVFIFRSKALYKKYLLNTIICFLLLNLASLSFAVSLDSQSSDLELGDFQTEEIKGSAFSPKLSQSIQTEELQGSASSSKLSQSIQQDSKINKNQKISEITSTSMETAKKPVKESLPALEELSPIENLSAADIASTDLSKIDFFWKASFQIQNFNDETTTNGVISTKIYGDLKWDLTEEFSFQSQALFIGRNGFTQSIYDREDRSRGLYLLESFLSGSLEILFFPLNLEILNRVFYKLLFL